MQSVQEAETHLDHNLTCWHLGTEKTNSQRSHLQVTENYNQDHLRDTIIIISAESTATWIYDLFKVFHVLRFMSSLESVRGEPGPASSLSFKYNLGRRRLSPALFLHHRDYMWQVTLHAVTQETVVVRARYTTGRTITLNNIDGTYRSSDAHGANDGRSASGVPLGRRPRTASPTPCSMHRCTASTWLWR